MKEKQYYNISENFALSNMDVVLTTDGHNRMSTEQVLTTEGTEVIMILIVIDRRGREDWPQKAQKTQNF